MISIDLTGNERLQIANILPVQGDLNTLRLVDEILKKAKISDIKEMKELNKIDFEENEINFIKEMINLLDSKQMLKFESLSLIEKFMNIKETKNV